MEQRRQLLRDQTGIFNMPNLMNLFGGQVPPQQNEIRPQVVDMMQQQQQQNMQPGTSFFNIPGLFGIGDGGFTTTGPARPPANAPSFPGQDQNPMQKAIGSIYNLTGDEAGTIKNTSPTEPGFMERLGNLSGDEMIQGLQGIQGLLDAVTPPEQELTPAKIYGASPGLSLNINPYEELYKRQGILRG